MIKDPVIIGGRSQGKAMAERVTREICELVLREREARGHHYSAGVVDRAVKAAVPLFVGYSHGFTGAIERAFVQSELAA